MPASHREQLEKAAAGYGWPQFGENAELRSLVKHSVLADGLRDDTMPLGQRRRVLWGLVQDYEAARWSIPSDFATWSHFERAVRELDWRSSPGYPYCRQAPTNGDWFQIDADGQPREERMREMWGIVELKLRGELGPDPIRLFVKPEPHKLRKLEEGRIRLISSVSVADQLVDHMVFGDMNKRLLENWAYTPSKPGWAPLNGGWKFVPRAKWTALDKSGWDWTVRVWMVEMTLALREALCENVTEAWKQVAERRYKELYFDPVFVTSGGLLISQKQPGVMKSGCVNTIADNSIMQVILHKRVCSDLGIDEGEIWAMGDDTLQEPVDQQQVYVDQLSQYCRVKQVVQGNEFAGFRFLGTRIEPMYRGKHAFTLLHFNDEDADMAQQFMNSYQLLYHRSAVSRWMCELILGMGYKVAPGWYCDAIYDGE